MPHFDSTISLGNIVALGVMLATFYKMHSDNVKRVQRIEFRVGMMWESFKKRFNIHDDLMGQEDNE